MGKFAREAREENFEDFGENEVPENYDYDYFTTDEVEKEYLEDLKGFYKYEESGMNDEEQINGVFIPKKLIMKKNKYIHTNWRGYEDYLSHNNHNNTKPNRI